jgi:hypothetical protein
MTITIFLSPTFNWCIAVEGGETFFTMHLRFPDQATALAFCAEHYPGITPTLEETVQPTLFDEPPTVKRGRGETRGKRATRRPKEAK